MPISAPEPHAAFSLRPKVSNLTKDQQLRPNNCCEQQQLMRHETKSGIAQNDDFESDSTQKCLAILRTSTYNPRYPKTLPFECQYNHTPIGASRASKIANTSSVGYPKSVHLAPGPTGSLPFISEQHGSDLNSGRDRSQAPHNVRL